MNAQASGFSQGCFVKTKGQEIFKEQTSKE